MSGLVRRGFFFLCGFGESWWSDTAIAGHGVWFQIHCCLYIFYIFGRHVCSCQPRRMTTVATDTYRDLSLVAFRQVLSSIGWNGMLLTSCWATP